MDAEVLKRSEVAVVDGFPEAELHRGPMPEPARDVLAVHAFRRGGQAQQLHRVLEQRAVAWGRGVVDLVDHDHVERLWIEGLDSFVAQ